jgi:hypothetical protein
MAYNTIGPALPQALRALRYLLYDPDGNFRETDKIDLDTMATACPEEHDAGVITAEEKQNWSKTQKLSILWRISSV